MNITDSCLDAETLAAWVDGGLSASELERAQTHVADCARCQAVVGTLARVTSAVPLAEPEPTRWRWLAWVVPLTAAAAAAAVWVAVPRNQLDSRVLLPQAEESQPQFQATRAIPQEPAAKADQAPASPVAEAPAPPARSVEMRRDAAPRSELDKLSKDTAQTGTVTAAIPAGQPPAASPADSQAASANALETAPPAFRREVAAPAAALTARAPLEPTEIVSPDPAFRWRIAGPLVQRSTNGGAAWENTSTGVTTALTGGAAPSPMVCWVVGRAGVVLLSTDGRRWRRVAFPEITDLSSVLARDDRSASVTTVDGRTFSTTVAGAVWTPGPLQGF